MYTGCVARFFDALVEMEKKDKMRNEMLSDVDKAISDVIHYIENCNFSGSDGYKFSARLNQLRRLRRELKAEFEQIDIVKQRFNIGKSISFLSSNQHKTESTGDYRARVLTKEQALDINTKVKTSSGLYV